MKKYLLVIFVFSFVLLWCKRNDTHEIDPSKITDLVALQEVITQVSDEMSAGTINMEIAQDLIDQLQQKYVDLTDTTQKNIENQFITIQKAFDKQSITFYWLPLRAKKLWMIEPTWMDFDKMLSKQTYTSDNGYTSTILVYKWDYAVAIQQAKLIAQNAHLYVSKDFQQAQSLAKVGDVNYISGLDIEGLSKWIVYVNHELLDTNMDNLLSVSVDQEGTLIIEATKTN